MSVYGWPGPGTTIGGQTCADCGPGTVTVTVVDVNVVTERARITTHCSTCNRGRVLEPPRFMPQHHLTYLGQLLLNLSFN